MPRSLLLRLVNRHRSFAAFLIDLFAYMEVEDFDRFLRTMAGSQANQRWQQYMSEIMTMETDPVTGFPHLLPEVFHLD